LSGETFSVILKPGGDMFSRKINGYSMITTFLLFMVVCTFSLPPRADELKEGNTKNVRIEPDQYEMSPSTQNDERADKQIGYGFLIDRSGSMLTRDAPDADISGVFHTRFDAAIEKAEKDFLGFFELWYVIHGGDPAYSYYGLVMHFGDDIVPPPPWATAIAAVLTNFISLVFPVHIQLARRRHWYREWPRLWISLSIIASADIIILNTFTYIPMEGKIPLYIILVRTHGPSVTIAFSMAESTPIIGITIVIPVTRAMNAAITTPFGILQHVSITNVVWVLRSAITSM
jgi:hypothetical protein